MLHSQLNAQQLDEEVKNDYNLIGMLKADETTSSKRRLIGKSGSLLEKQKVALNDNTRDMMICFCITMYNEDWGLLQKTLSGVTDNIYRILQSNPNYHSNQFAIFLIADGLAPIKYDDFLAHAYKRVNGAYSLADFSRLNSDENKAMLNIVPKDKANVNDPTYDINSTLKFTKEDGDKISHYFLNKNEEFDNYILEKNVVHLFATCGKCDLGLTTDDKYREQNGTTHHFTTDINFYFAIKHLNGGKLDSQYWFFKGFCEYLNPRYTFLVDCGTKPMGDSILRLFSYMERNPNCGGSCGEIQVEMDKCCNPVVLAQFVEYKYAHFIDKAYESAFGFITVLPGAFSMFRWSAIMGLPLNNYFLGLNKAVLNCMQANMFLAEDRIMCLSIVAKPDSKYYLFYDSRSYAETDPPSDMKTLIKQRRRWINGSNFATLFVLYHFLPQVFKTKHNACRKVSFIFQFIYMAVNTLMVFLLPALMYSSFCQLNESLITNATLKFALEIIYGSVLFVILIMSIASPLDNAILYFQVSSIILGLFFILNMVEFYFYIFKKNLITLRGKNNPDNVLNNKNSTTTQRIDFLIELISSFLTLSLYFFPIFFNCCQIRKTCSMVLGWFVYMFVVPLYSIIFVMFAYCNVHDLSWGNREEAAMASDAQSKAKKQNEYKVFRSVLLIAWVATNVGIYILIRKLGGKAEANTIIIIKIMAYILLAINLFRLIFSILYLFKKCCLYTHFFATEGNQNRTMKPAIPGELN
jgi:cellulose synthase/poly-beta-1,6-N-acetylglucosamine synthase-like glycosyltransferase